MLKFCLFAGTAVAVAQLVESRIVIPVVVGSSPIVHPTPSRSVVRLDSRPFPRRRVMRAPCRHWAGCRRRFMFPSAAAAP